MDRSKGLQLAYTSYSVSLLLRSGCI